MNTKEPDPQAVKCFDELMDSARWKWTDTLSRYLKEAREEEGKRLVAECDSLKGSNAELREQLAANAKFISELQHTIRLVQGAHAQQIHECAERAAYQIYLDMVYMESHSSIGPDVRKERMRAIICEAFGAPLKPKDECAEAFQREWQDNRDKYSCPMGDALRAFEVAWELAKGRKHE